MMMLLDVGDVMSPWPNRENNQVLLNIYSTIYFTNSATVGFTKWIEQNIGISLRPMLPSHSIDVCVLSHKVWEMRQVPYSSKQYNMVPISYILISHYFCYLTNDLAFVTLVQFHQLGARCKLQKVRQILNILKNVLIYNKALLFWSYVLHRVGEIGS